MQIVIAYCITHGFVTTSWSYELRKRKCNSIMLGQLLLQTLLLVELLEYRQASLILSDPQVDVNVTLGQRFTFYCTGCRYDEVALRRNGERILTVDSCPIDPTDSEKYSLSCSYGLLSEVILTITIPAENMTEEEHNSKWICSSPHFGWCYPLPCQTLNLYVQVPVKKMEIFNALQNLTLVKEGHELICMTSGIRPPAMITWYIDGQKVRNESLITYSTSGNETELFTSHSKLRIWGDPSTMETRTIYCEGSNILERNPVQSVPVQIKTLFNPGESPQIEGYYSGTRLLTTDPPLQLSCKIRKSWPFPSLSWICPSYSTNENISYTDGYVISKIRVDVDLDLDGKVCTCVATHSVDNFNRQVSVTFVVLGPQYIDSKTGVITLSVGVISLVGSLALVIITVIRNKYLCRMPFRRKEKKGTSERNTDVTMTSVTEASRQLYEKWTETSRLRLLIPHCAKRINLKGSDFSKFRTRKQNQKKNLIDNWKSTKTHHSGERKIYIQAE